MTLLKGCMKRFRGIEIIAYSGNLMPSLQSSSIDSSSSPLPSEAIQFCLDSMTTIVVGKGPPNIVGSKDYDRDQEHTLNSSMTKIQSWAFV